MTSPERRRVREALAAVGFARAWYTDESPAQDGRYMEVWEHADGTVVGVNWGVRDRETSLPANP